MNELETLSKISALIEPMSVDGKRRAITYLNDLYGIDKPTTKKKNFMLVKDLGLNPEGRISAHRVAEQYELRRENKQIKCLIAVSYISDYLNKKVYEVGPVTVDHVASFFHEVKWELPADLRNTISQSAREGWIDSSNTTDLKTTEKGRALLNDVWEPGYLKVFKSRTISAESPPPVDSKAAKAMFGRS